MAKFMTLERLEAVRQEHQILWEWADGIVPPTRYRKVGKRAENRMEVYLLCGRCRNYRWVDWDILKKGKSKACCQMPTLFEMLRIARDLGSLYTPTEKNELRGNKRYVWMHCKCGTSKWVEWGRLRRGLAQGCASCRNNNRKHDRLHVGMRDPVFVAWQDMLRLRGKRKVTASWHTFENFEEWARPLYTKGWRLKRLDRQRPYGPENCDYVPVNVNHAEELLKVAALPFGKQKVG